MNSYPEFVNLLNNYLTAEDRSPTWLAGRLGVNPSTVVRWLNHDKRPGNSETVIRIADILGIHNHKERQALLAAAGYGYVEGVGNPLEADSSLDSEEKISEELTSTEEEDAEPTDIPLGGKLSPRWLMISGISGILLLCTLIIFRLFLSPWIAVWYNNQGLNDYLADDLASAQADYEWALFFNPTYPEAHYNLGLLYEDWLDFERAQQEYELAAQNGLDAAYNNLARLYIRDETYSDAVSWLKRGLERTSDDEVRYDMLKNLGWARLGLEHYAQAESHLREAIGLKPDYAPAYCLLAQVREGQKKREEALEAWDNCLKYADSRLPEEDVWLNMARERLKNEGE